MTTVAVQIDFVSVNNPLVSIQYFSIKYITIHVTDSVVVMYLALWFLAQPVTGVHHLWGWTKRVFA